MYSSSRWHTIIIPVLLRTRTIKASFSISSLITSFQPCCWWSLKANHSRSSSTRRRTLLTASSTTLQRQRPYLLTTISNKNNNCNKRRLTVQFHSDSKYPARDWSNYKEYIDRDKPNVASTSETRDNTDYYYHFYKTNKLEDNMPRKEKLAAGDGTVDIDAAETQKRSFAREYIDPETKLMVIEEGSCSMCIEASEMNQVFYNPVQVQNRDLSILMLHVHHERRQAALNVQVDAYRVRRSELLSQHRKQQQELQSEKDEKNEGTVSMNAATNVDVSSTEDVDSVAIATTTNDAADSKVTTEQILDDDIVIETPKLQLKVLDALAASGLRSLRYWKECSNMISHLTINDIDPVAGQRARRNIERNGLSDVLIPDTQPDGQPPGIRVTSQDATTIMYNSRNHPRKLSCLPSLAHLHDNFTPPPEKLHTELEICWDVIDLDPYGSSVKFMDAAVQAIANGGLLNVTCTDMRTMIGSSTVAAFSRYGSVPIKTVGHSYNQDYAIRMVLYMIATAAARYGRCMKPILSVGMDFYIRVFIEIYDDKQGVQDLPMYVGMVHQSTQCPSFSTVPLADRENKKGISSSRIPSAVCTETGAPLKMGGPIWLGPLHDPDVLQRALQLLPDSPKRSGTTTNNAPHQPNYDDDKNNNNNNNNDPSTMQQSSSLSTSTGPLKYIATRDRLRGLLTSCIEELPDAPLYYVLSGLANCIKSSVPPLLEFKSAIVNAGYRVSGHHKEPNAIKTDAPTSVMWDIMRAWVKRRPLSKPPAPGSAAEKILSVEPSIAVDFSRPLIVHRMKQTFANATRFPQNPEKNWGPKPRALHGQKRKSTNEELE